MGTFDAIAGLRAAALDLLAPPRCLACGDAESRRLGLCRGCVRLVPRPWPDPCPRCAGRLGPGVPVAACHACRGLRPRFSAALAAGPYAGFLGELVRRGKYGGDPVLAAPLARLLSHAVERWPDAFGVDAVVPVPTTRQRLRERGFHLAELLAGSVADALSLPLRPTALRRVGNPPPQAALPRSERRKAARGTVEVAAPRLPWQRATPIEGLKLLLVDDVLTTGATANESARALLGAGASEVLVAVAARA